MGKDSSVGATQGEGTWGRQAGWLGAPLPPAYPENRSWGPGPLEKAVDPGSRGGGEESGASLGDVSLYGELLLRMGVLGVLYPGSSATLSGGLASLSFGSLVVGVGGEYTLVLRQQAGAALPSHTQDPLGPSPFPTGRGR